MLCGYSCQDQQQHLSQGCAAVKQREQLGDIATEGPMALNIINPWSDIILNFQTMLQIISAPLPQVCISRNKLQKGNLHLAYLPMIGDSEL